MSEEKSIWAVIEIVPTAGIWWYGANFQVVANRCLVVFDQHRAANMGFMQIGHPEEHGGSWIWTHPKVEPES